MEERKSGKKTRGIIIAAMLVLLLAIGCLCGITFAKYVTSKSVSTQSATVAKWGFVISANANDLFGKEYAVTGEETLAKKVADGSGVAVVAKKAAVAPGTTGEMTFSIVGNAEVPAQIKITAGADVKEVALKGTDGNPVWSPVKWTIWASADDTTYTEIKEAGAEGDKITADGSLATALALASKQGGTIAASTTETKKYFKLSWSWAFDGATADSTNGNRYDTLLGYAAAGDKTYTDATVSTAEGGAITVVDKSVSPEVTYTADTTISFSLTITVEQVQKTA